MEMQLRPTRAPGFVGVLNPIAERLLRAGPWLGPNALITIKGRKTGEPRTTPIALISIDGRRWVVGTFGDTNWVRNLRAAGRATITVGRVQSEVKASELDLQQRATFFQDVLGPYARKFLIGPLLLFILGAREILDDPVAAARRRPVFELHAA